MVFDIAGKTPVEDLISLVPEPSQVVCIADFAAAQAGARVTGWQHDSRPMETLALVAELLAQNKVVIKVQPFPSDRRSLPHQPGRPHPRQARPRPLKRPSSTAAPCGTGGR